VLLRVLFRMPTQQVTPLISTEQLTLRVQELGRQISMDYIDSAIHMVTVMRGALFFFADLARAIEAPVSVDYMSIAPAPGAPPTALRIIKDLDESIAGRDVLLVTDIVDSGFTLSNVIKLLAIRDPASVRVCTLLERPARHAVPCRIDYIGFEITEPVVVGYGMEWQGYYCNLPYVAAVKLPMCQT